MKFKKTGEKTVTVTYREIDIDLTGLKINPDSRYEFDEYNMSVRLYDKGADVFCDGMMVESSGSGDDDFCDNWARYYYLVLALVNACELEDFIDCYGNPWSNNTMRKAFREWVEEYPEFLTPEIKEFIEEEDEDEDEFDEDSY